MLRHLFRLYAYTAILLAFQCRIYAENLLPGDSSFETGCGNIITGSFSGKATCTVKCGNAADGKAFAELNFIAADKTLNRLFHISQDQDGQIFTFSVYAKSNMEGLNCRLSMIRNNWTNTITGNYLPLTREWKRYTVAGKLKKGEYWLCFEADKPGTVDVDAFQLEQSTKASPYKNQDGIYLGLSIPGESSYVFFENEKVPISFFVSAQGKGNDPEGTTLSVTISDYNRQTLLQQALPVVMKDGIFKTDFAFTPPRLGWFKVKAELLKNKKVIAENSSAFCSTAQPPAIAEDRTPFCGSDGAQFPGIRRIGAGNWVQVLLYWNAVESVKGQYKWPDLKWVHDSGRKLKLTLGHLPSAPRWTWDPAELKESLEMKVKLSHGGLLPAPEYLENWRNFVRLTAERYKNQADFIEIGAEDDLTFGGNAYYLKKFPKDTYRGKLVSGPAYDRYLELVKSACEEVKKIAPNLKTGIVRPSNVDCYHYKFSSPVINACRNIFDLFPVDCYPNGPRYIGPGRPETPLPENCLPAALEMALETCRSNGNGQHVYVSEFGYALDYTSEADSSYAMEMVKRLVRSYLVARMIPGIETFHWFITSDGCIEAEKYHYGLWRFGMPLPTVPAYSAVANVVENVTGIKELSLGGDSKAVVFKKEGRADAAVWFVRGDGKLLFGKPNQDLVVKDFMGNTLPQSETIHIGEFPVYFGMNGNDASDKLINILSGSRMICRPVEISFITPRSNEVILQIKNIAGKDIDATAAINNKEQKLSLKKGQTAEVDVSLDKTAAQLDVSIDCGDAYEKVNASCPMEFESCQKIEFTCKIDADLSEWNGRPFIAMNERGQIMPPDPWIDWKGPEQFSAKVYTGWDDKYFYMAAEVKDEVHSNKFTDTIYKGDSIQFAFDPAANGGKSGYGQDDKELGIALADNKIIAAQWAGKNVLKASRYAVKRDDNAEKTFYEIQIPLHSLGIKEEEGTVFGFNFVIFNDNTGAGANYYYQLSPGITGIKSPAQFKKFELAR